MNIDIKKMQSKLFYFEPALKNFSGHYLETFLCIKTYCSKLYKITLFGSIDIGNSIKTEQQIIPFFSSIREKKYKYIPSSVNRLISFLKKRDYFAGVFTKFLTEKADSDTTLFFPSLEISEILGVLVALHKTKAPCRAVFILRYTFSPWTVRFLVKKIRNTGCSARIRFYSDSSLLIDYYRKSGLDCVSLIPIPHLPEIPPSDIIWTGKNRPIHILYAGGARVDKGIDQLPAVIRHIRKIFPQKEIIFSVHSYISGNPTEKDKITIQKTLQYLEREQVHLISSSLEREKYYQMLSEADIILFPYINRDLQHRYFATSGILAEALALAKVVVVPVGTWLEAQVQKSGSGTFFHDKDDLPHAVEDAILRLDELQNKAYTFMPYWKERNSIERYVHLLFEDKKGTSQ